MNFFQAQDDARRNTWRLGLLFAAAVVTLMLLTNLLVAGVYLWTFNISAGNLNTPIPSPGQLLNSMPWQNWALISTGVAGVVAVASLYKYLLIRGGGRTVAESLGGRRIAQSTTDFKERRLLNVVEEMAIASGIPVPPVYLIPEAGINAFAAGFSPDDAVIGINQGTVDQLNRDELQGVIGHEFSHVLNGDMRINLRLIALLHGIVFIGMIGYGILRGMGRGLGSGSRRSSSSSSGLPVLALGVGLLIIGYGGTFFGNLIKAAVSRQREYLADAASVQFTRNPGGLADALKKIGALPAGSTMSSRAAEQASHMFFGQVRPLFLNSLLATHPPLERRIRAIDPRWDGRYPTLTPEQGAAQTTAEAAPDRAAFAGAAPVPAHSGVQTTVGTQALVNRVGQLDQQGLNAAIELIDTTNASLRAAAHDPWGSRALIYAMLLHADAAQAAGQLELMRQQAEPGVPELIDGLRGAVAQLDAPHRITLIEMAMPALKELSSPQYQRFMATVTTVIKSDRQIELLEWVLHRLLVKELSPHFERPRRQRSRYGSIQRVAQAAVTLLSALAREGDPDNLQAQTRALNAGLEQLGIPGVLDAEPDPNFARMNDALGQLRELKPLLKPRLLKACAATALADGQVEGREGALLHGIAATLDCPLPPSIYSRA